MKRIEELIKENAQQKEHIQQRDNIIERYSIQIKV
jgi:hypothetical protein